MGFTKPCVSLALVAGFASIALLLCTMLIPNWVKAVYRTPGGEDCQVGNLGAFEAQLTVDDGTCGADTPLGEYDSFTSDTIEFWPLFPTVATGNGNPLLENGVIPEEFETCEASLDFLDTTVEAQVQGLTAGLPNTVRQIGVGGAQLVDGVVASLGGLLQGSVDAASAYQGVVATAFSAGLSAGDYFNEADSTLLDGVFAGVAAFANSTADAVEEGFVAIGEACWCRGEKDGCETDTSVAAATIAGTIASVSGVVYSCDDFAGQTVIGQAFARYVGLTGSRDAAGVQAFTAGSYTFFNAIIAGEVTNENRYKAMHTNLAQAFINSDSVKQLVYVAAKASAGLDPEIVDSMLSLVKVAACFDPLRAIADNMNEVCDADTVGLVFVFWYANTLGTNPNPTAQELLNYYGPAITFNGLEATAVLAGQAGACLQGAAATPPTCNPTPLFAQLVAAGKLFEEPTIATMFSNDAEFQALVGPTFNATTGGLAGAIIEQLARCGCDESSTATSKAVVCTDEAVVQLNALRTALNGSPAAINDTATCVTFLKELNKQSTYGLAWSGFEVGTGREAAEQQCEDDVTDIEHIKLGRTMLIVAMPILSIGVLAGAFAATKMSVANSSFSKVALVAGVSSFIAAGLTMYGLLHVRAAPVYAAVGEPCEEGACYENDFAAQLALGAVVAPIVAGVSFLVASFMGPDAESEGEDLESKTGSEIVANPKYGGNPNFSL